MNSNEKELFDKLEEHNISVTIFWGFGGEINDIKINTAEHDAMVRTDVIEKFKTRTLTNFCYYCNQQACDGGMVGSLQECETIRVLRDVLEDISDELKEKKDE